MSDGKVVIDTELDDGGFRQGLSKLSSIASTGLKATAGAITAVGTASAVTATKLTKSAVSAYANYEQLVGGVETLFGAGGQSLAEYAQSVEQSVDDVKSEYENLISSQNVVLEDSKEAFKTAGLSANEYMETVTSFSASLISSLDGDTQKAAQLSNQAIIDMSDNANKMGSSMESIQNAYAGFAKQNYTMLDNLKLGYGGTKSEMERLIADANELREAQGLNSDLTIESYADVIEAIHTIQDEMGIYGTTAKEAEETIQGSLSMTKAAWHNLVTGLADENADIDVLLDDLIYSVEALRSNLIPRIEQALSGIGTLVDKVVPIIQAKLPGLIKDLFPKITSSIGSLISQVTEALPELLPTLADGLIELFHMGIESLAENAPELIESLLEIFQSIVDELGLDIDFTGMFSGIEDILNGFSENVIPTLQGVLDLLNPVLSVASSLLSGIIQYLGDMLNNKEAVAVLEGLAIGIGIVVAAIELWSIAQTILNAVLLANPLNLVMVAIIAIGVLIAEMIVYWDEIKYALGLLWDKIKEIFNNIKEKIEGVIDSVVEAFSSGWNTIKTFFTETIPEGFQALKEKIVEIFESIVEGIKEKFENVKESVQEVIDTVTGFFEDLIDSALSWGADMINGFIDGIKGGIDKVGEAVSGVADKVSSFLHFSVPDEGPLADADTYMPDFMELLAEGIKDNYYKVLDATEQIATGINTTINPNDGLYTISDGFSDSGFGSQVININQPIGTVDELADEFNIMNKYGLMRG